MHSSEQTQADKAQALIFLSVLCFSMADVRDGLGPFLGVYLQGQGWAPDAIGYAMTLGGLASMLCIAPLGALVDRTVHKRLLLGMAALGTVLACYLIFIVASTPVVWLSKILQGVLGAIVAPGLCSLTLGLVGQKNLPHQLGSNEAWNHAGNCSSALLGGLVGYYYGIPGVFAVMAVMGGIAVFSLWRIRPALINHAVARGLESEGMSALPVREIVHNVGLLAVAVVLFFFHLGNAAMLPLLGQSAVARFQMNPAVYTAGTVVIAQLTMIGMSLWGARAAQQRGYGLLFWAALLALPVRGLIAGGFDSPWSIVPVQLLDGVGAGLLGVATPGIVARLLDGTGRVNLGLGLVLAVQGVGAALSTSLGGLVAHVAGYSMAFYALAACPVVGLLLFLVAMRFSPTLTKAAWCGH